MFNEDKAIKLHVDGEIIGCIRIIRPARTHNFNRTCFVVLFLARDLVSDEKIQKMCYKECSWISRELHKRWGTTWRVVLPFLPPMVTDALEFRTGARQQFGGTRVRPSSSVLIDEATGQPLF